MLGHKVRDFKPFTATCLDDLVPADNFYRHSEQMVFLKNLFYPFNIPGTLRQAKNKG
jgi:hypothetical protein